MIQVSSSCEYGLYVSTLPPSYPHPASSPRVGRLFESPSHLVLAFVDRHSKVRSSILSQPTHPYTFAIGVRSSSQSPTSSSSVRPSQDPTHPNALHGTHPYVHIPVLPGGTVTLVGLVIKDYVGESVLSAFVFPPSVVKV